jgi:Adenosine deaminase
MQDSFDSAREFVKRVKTHNVSEEGVINNSAIEKITNYSIRQFSRIFSNYSALTPFEYAERFRLLQCVDYIKRGNTLKDASVQFGYTPEGLSNSLKVNLGLSVEKIRREGFILKKDIKISSLWKRIDSFKLQYSKDIFFPLLESLDNEKILKYIRAKDLEHFNLQSDWFDIVLDYKKILEILEDVDGYAIEKQIYEEFSLSDQAILYIILKKVRDTGVTKVTLRNDEICKCFLIVGFFYDTESPELLNGKYVFRLDDDIRTIFESLAEIETDMNETYDMTLRATMDGNKVTLELGDVYKKALMLGKDLY